jgi:hypothetical protein
LGRLTWFQTTLGCSVSCWNIRQSRPYPLRPQGWSVHTTAPRSGHQRKHVVAAACCCRCASPASCLLVCLSRCASRCRRLSLSKALSHCHLSVSCSPESYLESALANSHAAVRLQQGQWRSQLQHAAGPAPVWPRGSGPGFVLGGSLPNAMAQSVLRPETQQPNRRDAPARLSGRPHSELPATQHGTT